MYWDDVEIGVTIVSRKRVVTGTDIDMFTAMTGATNPMFMSDKVAKERGRPARLTPGPLLFSFTIGLCYQAGTFDQVVAMAGVKNMRFIAPVHPGDILTATATATEKKPTRDTSKGLVVLKHELKKNDGTLALEAEITYLLNAKV